MTDIEKSSPKPAQATIPLVTGFMAGEVHVDGQCMPFESSYVYADQNAEMFRFFGNMEIEGNPGDFTGIEVRLKPRTVESGGYTVGVDNVEISYVTPGYHVYQAKSGFVDFVRNDNLYMIFGAVRADFEIDGKPASICVSYYIRSWNP